MARAMRMAATGCRNRNEPSARSRATLLSPLPCPATITGAGWAARGLSIGAGTPNSGWIDDQVLDPPEQYWRIGPYLIEDETIEEVEKDVFIPFIHRPLSRYVNALATNGLLLQRMHEPAPPAGFLAKAQEYQAAATIPRLLYLRTTKLDHVPSSV